MVNQASTGIWRCKVSGLPKPKLNEKIKIKEPLPEKEVISMA
jgi:hypothetical protein